MTNFEYYKNELLKTGTGFGVSKSGEIISCDDCFDDCCPDCIFFDLNRDCGIGAMKWLWEEHIEKPKLSANAHEVLKRLNIKYVVKDENGWVYGYLTKPTKYKKQDSRKGYWIDTCSSFLLYGAQSKEYLIRDESFDFIKWEDDEPWSVEELLKLEVK